MIVMMFDDRGDAVDPAVEAWKFKLDLVRNTFDFCRFMVVNSGWVAVTRRGAKVTVSLRPAKVSQVALAAALYHLHELPTSLGTLVAYDGGHPKSYEFQTKTALVAAICNTVTDAEEISSQRFMRRHVHSQSADVPADISSLVGAWKELNGSLDIERLWRLLTVAFSGRYILAAARSRGLVLDTMGRGFCELANYWSQDRPAPKISDQPDAAFGRWVERAYRDAANRKSPLVEMVDCEISWPNEGKRRHQYWRAILPFSRPHDRAELLLSVTLPDHSISLRDGISLEGR